MMKKGFGAAASVVLLLCAVFTGVRKSTRRIAAARPSGEGALQRSVR